MRTVRKADQVKHNTPASATPLRWGRQFRLTRRPPVQAVNTSGNPGMSMNTSADLSARIATPTPTRIARPNIPNRSRHPIRLAASHQMPKRSVVKAPAPKTTRNPVTPSETPNLLQLIMEYTIQNMPRTKAGGHNRGRFSDAGIVPSTGEEGDALRACWLVMEGVLIRKSFERESACVASRR